MATSHRQLRRQPSDFSAHTTMAGLVGYWILDKDDDQMDNFMKVMNMDVIHRKVGNTAKTHEDIRHDGEFWEMKLSTSYLNHTVKFKLDTEFNDTSFDGKKCVSKYVIEDSCLVTYQKYTDANKPNTKITRKLVDKNTMTATYEALGKDVTTVRTFKRQSTAQK